jgi:hypothetical protein
MCDGVSEVAAAAGAAAASSAATAGGIGLSGILAAGGLAASAIGSGIQFIASSNASAAANRAQAQSIAAQNTAFQARNAAQIQQTQEQAAAQNQGQAEYLRNQQIMRQNQSEALQQKQDTVAKMNLQEQQIQDQTRGQVQNTTQNVITPQTLQEAQAASEAQRVAGVAPVVADIRASDPTAAPAASPTVKSAMAEEMARAADYTKQYGANLAKVGAYSAPVATTNIATKELGGNLMPAASADQLLKAGASARLLPSSVAYQNATNLGQSEIASNTQRTTDLMNLTKMKETNAVDLANLGQADTNANIQTGLNYAQARAAALKSLGSGVSGLGNAGITYAASTGGFGDLFSSLGLSDSVTASQAAAAKAYQAGAFSAVPSGTYGPFV